MPPANKPIINVSLLPQVGVPQAEWQDRTVAAEKYLDSEHTSNNRALLHYVGTS